MKLMSLPPERVRELWIIVEKWVNDATSRSNGRYTPEDVLAGVESGHMQMWLAWEEEEKKALAVAVTQLVTYPTGQKWADILITTGENRKAWKHLLGGLEDWAKTEDCAGFQIMARTGWARELKDYKKSHVFLEKTFDKTPEPELEGAVVLEGAE